MSELTKFKKTRYKIYILFLLLIYFHASTANEFFFTKSTLQENIKNKKLSLISADIEITKINSNLSKNTNAKWTLNAQNNIRFFLNELFSNRDNEFYEYKIPYGKSKTEIIELISLQGLVNNSILSNFQVPLPSKDNFNWSIGPDAELLKISSGADYGLFLSFRASFSGTSKVADYQVGMLSLVDLTSGQTVWFTLQSDLKGDIRDKKQASSVIHDMLKVFPETES